MSRKSREIILIRSLTGSDLGIFAAHRGIASSKQRAININSSAAAVLLSKAAFRAESIILDCSCSYQGLTDHAGRHCGKIHKNWRLGGNKLEGAAYGAIDSADFVLIRSVEANDGSQPVSITFVARRSDPKGHARLSGLVANRLKQSMVIIAEADPAFADLVEFFPHSPTATTKTAAVSRLPAVRAVRRAPEVPVVVPPMPEPALPPKRPRTVKEKLKSPHIMEQMLKASSDMSAPAQLSFMSTVEQLASQLREVLLASARIISIEKDHHGLWKQMAGRKIGFVDGGMANLSMVGAAPVAVRVGSYVVTPGDTTSDREEFETVKKLIAELYSDSTGGVYTGSFPDAGALRDAGRIAIEASGAVQVLTNHPQISWLFMHGALINPVSRYTDVMRDGRTRYQFPNFSADALEQLLPAADRNRTGRDTNFISVYLRQTQLLAQSQAVVCGVVERESHSISVITQLIRGLDNETIRPLLHLPPDEWKDWFISCIDPTDEDEGRGPRISDPLLFRCVLQPGEALVPVLIDRNDDRRAPEAWKALIRQIPKPFVTYLQPTEWNAPVRMEMFGKDLERFKQTASLILHCSLLLPKYAFPVGLDIVDKYAKIPDWMSRPVNTNTVVQSLRRALDQGDMQLFDALRRMLCGSQREWFLRPKVFN